VWKKDELWPAADAATSVLFYHGNAGAEEIVSFNDILILNIIQILGAAMKVNLRVFMLKFKFFAQGSEGNRLIGLAFLLRSITDLLCQERKHFPSQLLTPVKKSSFPISRDATDEISFRSTCKELTNIKVECKA